MSLLCLAHHAVRLWRSPRRYPRGATNPVQISWKSHVFFPLSWGRWPSLIRRNRSHRTVYMYIITTVHLDFFRALQVSRPDTQAHIRVPHMQCVRVCVHAHTQHIHINPLQKIGRHFPCPNESLTLETNANRRPAGKNPLTPLLHTDAIVFKTPVNGAENTC